MAANFEIVEFRAYFTNLDIIRSHLTVDHLSLFLVKADAMLAGCLQLLPSHARATVESCPMAL